MGILMLAFASPEELGMSSGKIAFNAARYIIFKNNDIFG